MNKRNIFIIICIVIVFVIILLKVMNNKTDKSKIENKVQEENVLLNIIQKDFSTYMIKKEDGTTIVTNSIEEAEWYQRHPDFNPEPVHVD